jgi:hypothetical protein
MVTLNWLLGVLVLCVGIGICGAFLMLFAVGLGTGALNIIDALKKRRRNV